MKLYGIIPVYAISGLITFLSAKGLHTSLRDDYIPSATDYIQGFALISDKIRTVVIK
jgi:hypothetical protein